MRPHKEYCMITDESAVSNKLPTGEYLNKFFKRVDKIENQSFESALYSYITNGFWPQKPYYMETYTRKCTSFQQRYDWGFRWSPYGWHKSLKESYAWLSPVPNRAPASLANKATEVAIKKYFQSIKRVNSQVLVEYAERKKSANMILKTVATVGNVCHELYRLNFSGVLTLLGIKEPRGGNARRKSQKKWLAKAKKERAKFRRKNGLPKGSSLPDIRTMSRASSGLQAIAGFHMSIRYGWMPLVYGLDGAMKALSSKPPQPTIRAFGKRRETSSINLDDPQIFQTGNSKHAVTISITGIYSLKNSVAEYAHRIGLDAVAPSIYEVIPYSWMLDWVYPVGTYLNNLDATAYLTHRTCAYSSFEENEISLSQHEDTNAPKSSRHYDGNISGSGTSVVFSRIIADPPTVPLPTLDLSGVLKPMRIADTFALTTLKILGKKGDLAKYRI